MATDEFTNAPARRWEEDAARPTGDARLRLRLAAMAGHMTVDAVAARRGSLVDILADGRPHPREELIGVLADQLGDDCWGARPHEALMHDIDTLRRGGVQVAYSRRPGLEGYYLSYPALGDNKGRGLEKAVDLLWTRKLVAMSVAQKNEAAFAAADFALRQKRLIIREEQPDWSEERVEREARRLVFGAAGG